MDRSLGEQEQEKVRAARASYFNLHKRKASSTQIAPPKGTTSTTTSTADNQPNTMSSSKRFKFPGMTSTKPTGTASNTPLIVRFYDADIQARDAHGRTQKDILAWPDSKLESCHNYIQMLFPVPEGSAFNWEAPIIDREVMDTFHARSDLRSQLRRSFERMLDFYGFEVTVQGEQKEAAEEEQAKAQVEDGSDKAGKIETEGAAGAEMTETATEATENSSADVASSSSVPKVIKQDSAAKASEIPAQAKSSLLPGATSEAAPFTYHIIRAEHWRKNFRNWAVRFDHNHLRITRILRCLRILGLQKECEAFFAALKTVFEDPAINISERSMMYWTRAVTRPLYIAPDDDRIEWLKEWEEEQAESKEETEKQKQDVDDEGNEEVQAKTEVKDE
jgi:hypothetical protein